ncbi:KilA-N domain-containing protein [Moraxella bovis]|uniref:KilA-N domain-containing protein n=1 Tax=Moraxella bovis TaxID=476 RepID=UPI002226CE06|nr:KilA-N domain-containing protein [Moraxella bovis]UZA25697.1 KilA-N domain-containing protein [Moraxella bovis]UZA28810.1 KilA-N domain-containing protein [Moraxella bovis]UZA41969.1 KilA-N domain-containing protein [Moraxella bovis]UZA47806.1 KilA-N domain-containing protein [Moraxella bovis]
MTNLVINSQSISQHNDFYSLNDLHRVSGGENRHRPTFFLQNQETQEMIAELEKENTVAYHTKQGKQGGTYACRELVYRYAMWISPKFSLIVIRAFDALNTGAIPCLPKSTAHDRTPLRQAVTALTAKFGLMHDEAYRLVHQYMGVNSIDEIALDDLPKAVAYVHSLLLSTHNNDQNAFWQMVGLLEHERISGEIRQLNDTINQAERLIRQARVQINQLNTGTGLLYDAFGEQYLPTKVPVLDKAQAFIDRQMAMKKKIGLIS